MITKMMSFLNSRLMIILENVPLALNHARARNLIHYVYIIGVTLSAYIDIILDII